MSQTIEIDADNEADRWRYTCPNGHRNWTPTNNHVYCVTCSRHHDVDPEYHELLDQRTGERVDWRDVVFE